MLRVPLYSRNPEVQKAERSWNRVLLGYLPYIGIGSLLAVLIPDHGVTSSMHSVVEVVARIVPSINRLAALSPLPEMTRTFGAFMWLVYPIFTVWALMRAPRLPRRFLPWSTLLLVMPLGAACLVFLGIAVPFFFLDQYPDQLGYLRGRGIAGLTFIVTSRLGHGTLGAAIFAFSSFSLVFAWRFAGDYPRLIAYNVQSRLERRTARE
jgi:hypothetical protein